MVHFEKEHQHQVGFVLTVLLRVVASLYSVNKQPKAYDICSRIFCTIAKHF